MGGMQNSTKSDRLTKSHKLIEVTPRRSSYVTEVERVPICHFSLLS